MLYSITYLELKEEVFNTLSGSIGGRGFLCGNLESSLSEYQYDFSDIQRILFSNLDDISYYSQLISYP